MNHQMSCVISIPQHQRLLGRLYSIPGSISLVAFGALEKFNR